MIEAGQVVFVKTTQEPVFVVSIDAAPDQPFSHEVKVRRPVMGDRGIEHVTNYFFTEELETLDEQRERIRNDFKQLHGTAIGAQGDSFGASKTQTIN